MRQTLIGAERLMCAIKNCVKKDNMTKFGIRFLVVGEKGRGSVFHGESEADEVAVLMMASITSFSRLFLSIK